MRGVLEAYGQAAAAMMNAEGADSVTFPSLASSRAGSTTLFAGSFSDDFAAKVHAQGSLYGAYYNTLSAGGVSAVFGGFVGPAQAARAPAAASFVAQSSPVVVSGDITTVALQPDNAVPAPATVVFLEASASSISLDDAVTRCDETLAGRLPGAVQHKHFLEYPIFSRHLRRYVLLFLSDWWRAAATRARRRSSGRCWARPSSWWSSPRRMPRSTSSRLLTGGRAGAARRLIDGCLGSNECVNLL